MYIDSNVYKVLIDFKDIDTMLVKHSWIRVFFLYFIYKDSKQIIKGKEVLV